MLQAGHVDPPSTVPQNPHRLLSRLLRCRRARKIAQFALRMRCLFRRHRTGPPGQAYSPATWTEAARADSGLGLGERGGERRACPPSPTVCRMRPLPQGVLLSLAPKSSSKWELHGRTQGEPRTVQAPSRRFPSGPNAAPMPVPIQTQYLDASSLTLQKVLLRISGQGNEARSYSGSARWGRF
jgi:hypothetical protein